MTSPDETTKTHYICQTYVNAPTARAGQTSLKVDKLFEYTSASQAQERAEREARSDDCAGADAYSITEDTDSGEVSAPEFLVRLGKVPELDDF